MTVYRIERAKYAQDALSGRGSALATGNRWNSQGTSLVYTSGSRALAMLEVAVHLDLNEDLPKDRVMVTINIPDTLSMQEVQLEDLPKNWDAKPPTLGTQFIGDDFAAASEAAVLKVPSCIVPEEYNYLINPRHPDARKIKVVSQSAMQFDKRLGRAKSNKT